MFQTPILDVAVGLIVVYIMLALACTSFNEWLAQALSFRAQTLKKVLLGLFGSDQQGLQFAKNLYEHPIFDSLTPGRPGSLPEFVPANLFSLALADHLELTPRVSPAASTPDKGTDAANSAPAANAEAQVTPPTTDSIINAINDAPLNDKGPLMLSLASMAILRAVTGVVPAGAHLLAKSLEGYCDLAFVLTGGSNTAPLTWAEGLQSLDSQITAAHRQIFDGQNYYNFIMHHLVI